MLQVNKFFFYIYRNMYDLDPWVKQKLSEKNYSFEKLKATENKLRGYPPHEQKGWVANPMVQYIINGYLNNLRAGQSGVSTGKAVVKKEDDKPAPPMETASDDEDDQNAFDLFD